MKKIYGNRNLIDTLDRMRSKERSPQAVIFHGENGSGKKLIADYYAAQLVCEKPVSGKPCGVCASCRNAESHNHPDIVYVKTEGKLEGFSVRAARNIISDVSVMPNNRTGRKIYIFRDCRNMSVQTQNMMLKLIEEPPSYAHFIFTAESKYEFLTTIISRCVCLGVSLCSEDEAEKSLAECGYGAKEIAEAVSCFHGNIGRCISYITDENVRRTVDLTKRIANSIIKGDEYGLNASFFSVGGDRNSLTGVLSIIDMLVRDCAVSGEGITSDIIGCLPHSAVGLADIISPYQSAKIHDSIEKARRAVQANVSVPLVVSSLCAEIMQIRS